MIRILYFLIFFFIFITKSHAEIIKKIKIDGNERITDETIIVFSKIEIGSDLNEKADDGSLPLEVACWS